jgi:hypothetical protein
MITLLVFLGVLIVSVGLTILVARLCRRRHHTEVPDDVKQQATELRRRAARLNAGSENIEQRARRLEQMLAVKRREE